MKKLLFILILFFPSSVVFAAFNNGGSFDTSPINQVSSTFTAVGYKATTGGYQFNDNTVQYTAADNPGNTLDTGSSTQTKNAGLTLNGKLTANTFALPSTNLTNLTGLLMISGNIFLHNAMASTFLGKNAGNSLGGGNSHVGIGENSLFSVNNGIENVGLGYFALGLNTDGSHNIGVGAFSGYDNSTGSNLTFLGDGTDVNQDGLTNATAVGADVILTNSNTVILGNGANVGIGNTNPNGLLEVGSNVLTVLSSGKSGFGTESPSSQLDVVGGSITVRGANAGINISGIDILSAINSTGTALSIFQSSVIASTTSILQGNATAYITVNSSTQTKTGGLTLGGTLTANALSGAGSNITGLNASNLGSGTIPNARLDYSSITAQTNTFNGNSQLVQTNSSGQLPTISGVNLTNLNASNLASGTVPNTRIDYSSITAQGNTFNSANQLVQINGSSQLPAISGINLTNLNASNLGSGTIPNTRIDYSSITAQGNVFNGATQLVQTNSSSQLPALSGINLTSLNASNLGSGTVPNTRIDYSSITAQGNTFNAANKLLQLNSSNFVPNSNLDPSSVTKQGIVVDLTGSTQTKTGGLTLGGNLTANSLSLSQNPNTPITLSGTNFITHVLNSSNTFVGYGAGNITMTGNSESAFGDYALPNNTTGIGNSAFGAYSLNNNTTSDYNSALGYFAGYSNTSGAAYNTFLGYGADVAAGNLTNATAIGANAIVGANNSMVLGAIGGGSDINVGIGTQIPSSKFDLNNGSITIRGTNAGINVVGGNITAVSFSGSGASLTGVSASLPLPGNATNYLQNYSTGTTYTITKSSINASQLQVNGSNVLDISGSTQTKTGGLNLSGYQGIGTTSPSSAFDVNNGSITVRGTNSGIRIVRTAAEQLQIDNPNASSQSLIGLYENNVSKWQTGKDTDEAFIIYNAVTGHIALRAGSSTDNVTLVPSAGNVALGNITPTAQLHTNGTVRFQNFGAGAATFDANGNISSVSDEKFKIIGSIFTRGLDDIRNIVPITYRYNELSGLDMEHDYTGFSAQNIRDNIPEAVYENEKGYLSLADKPIIAALVNAVNTLNTEVEDLKNRIKILEGN